MVIICSYLLVHPQGEWIDLRILYGLLFLYILSNVILYWVDQAWFRHSYFHIPLVIFDTSFLTGSLVISGRVETDFYLAYVLIIFLCAIWNSFSGFIALSILVIAGYGVFFFSVGKTHDPSTYLRLPFLFVIALFYGYFAQLFRFEKASKEMAEQQFQNMLLLHSVSQSLTSSLDLPQILRTLRDEINSVVRPTGIYFFKVDDPHHITQGRLYNLSHTGESEPRAVVFENYPMVSQALSSGNPAILDSTQCGPLIVGEQEPIKDVSFPVTAVFPVTVQGETEGAILIGFDQAHRILSLNEKEFCRIVATLTGVAVSNAKKYEALRVGEARLARIIETSPNGIVVSDRYGRITLANSVAEKMLGLCRNGVENWIYNEPACSIYALEEGQLLEKHFPLDSVIGTGKPLHEVRLAVQHANGNRIMTSVNVAPMHDMTGAVAGVISVWSDITDRFTVERIKADFVSTVSHELRTPLTALRASLVMLESGLLADMPEKGKRMLKIALQNTDRLVRLINDILDVERLESGRISMEKQFCNTADLIAQAKDVMQAMATGAKITLLTSPLSARVLADPDRIIQVLVNLLSNAIKFSPQGSMVWLYASAAEDEILFQVKDQGRGIPADKIKIIFERFQQVDSSDSRQKGGTGLGLAISRTIVRQHGGRIWAESTPGEGSTFFFTLPLLKEERSHDGQANSNN
ncbi:MAG: PAS domain-containing sensor histidine kinase [Candidatus Binatia bacterium]